MSTMTWDNALEAYERTRSSPHRECVCNAPMSSMYFAATGKVAPCWILLGHLEEYWGPERSVLDIWRGERFTELREALAAREFPGACSRCRDDIAMGVAPLAAVYDNEDPIGPWPNALELELSNLCNYACQMCNGELSSKIRREREHLPPLSVPYDATFVEQIAEVIPHLHRVRFSGGEPMLHPIVHKITDRIIELKPELRIDISTNGSIMNAKVRRLLDRAHVLINVSFDSLRAELYESIRVGSDFENLMTNLQTYQQHFADHPGMLTINTNPMRANWTEMPDFVRWCDDRGLYLTYNTVLHPAEMSLRTLPADELAEVARFYADTTFDPPPDGEAGGAARNNHAEFANLVQLTQRWHREAEQGGLPTTSVPVAAPSRSRLSEEQLAELAASAAGPGIPVVTMDIDPEHQITAIAPSSEHARLVGFEARPGLRCETPLDVLQPQLAHPDLVMDVDDLDPTTNQVSVTTPDGLDLAIWTREVHGGDGPAGLRAFITARTLPEIELRPTP